MRSVYVAVCVLFCTAGIALGQGASGTITGTVTDPAGAVVANATVAAKNAESGLTYPVQTTDTGNYTIPNLPVGTYELDVTVQGFKKYVRQGLTVGAAQVLRIDAALEVGTAAEAVTVTAEASMLKTETGDVSQNVTVQTLDELPMLAIGAAQSGSSGIRNPNNVLDITPGTYYVPNSQVKINGAPSNSQAYHVEGQDATNQGISFAPAETQPSVDAIQEVAIQTSNFAPEFGSAGGGFLNVTMKSGTNAFHGSGYDYFVNEVLNAGTPFTVDKAHPDEHLRPAARRNDYGFTIGGPVDIPKLYNGHDKTFFFFNFEQFRETQNINNNAVTVPTDAYRQGNFLGAEAALGFKQLGTDPLGRPIIANAIYNPTTARTVGGELVEDPFTGNAIPASMFDPVALKIQSLIPGPTSPASVNNFLPTYPSIRHTTIPSVKIDQQTGTKGHLSFYWSFTHTDSAFSPIYGQSEGFPVPITEDRGTFIHSHIERLNYDYTISPTLLLHLGAGHQQNDFFDDAPVLNYNAAQSLGLTGASINRNFPVFTGFCPAFGPGLPSCGGAGGMENMGPFAGQTHTYFEKPSGNISLTWVRGNHSYKAGGEVFYYSVPTFPYTNTAGNYGFSANETALPYLVGSSGTQALTGGTVGFPYASFLLGQVDSLNIAAPAVFRGYKSNWSAFIQDSWKITRKLTLDYGVRWDYGTYVKEEHGRAIDFSPSTPNPSVGGIPGGFLFEGSGAGQCKCNFAHNYPFALGPRVGLAYQVTPKTVIRAGWGIMYSQTAYFPAPIATTTTVTSPGQGQPVMTLAGGIPSQYAPSWPVFSPGLFPKNPAGNQALTGGIAGLGLIDPNAGRPARQNQWSIGFQQELSPNLVVSVQYVGNRGVWWPAPSLENLNALTPAILAAHGLDITNPEDQKLLLSPLSSPIATARGFGTPPYPEFSRRNSVAQSLRPFPQFGFLPTIADPLGKTWYDSLQMTVNKRYSHNLFVQAAFSYQKSLQEGVDTNGNLFVGSPGNPEVGAVGNPGLAKSISEFDQPLLLSVSASYAIPKLPGNKVVSWVFRDWQVGTLLEYASGLPIAVPGATTFLSNELFQPTLAERVPGQPLYNVPDINCHCYDPSKTFVLNKAAWVNPPQGYFSNSAPFYTDFRYQRHPIENMNLGRTWSFHERFALNLRVEFNNIFNRAFLNNPSATTPFLPVSTRDGLASGGFGYINLATSSIQFGQPRNGDIVMKFTF